MHDAPSRSDFEVVSLTDPAVDLERSNIHRYRMTRELEHLVFLDPTTEVDGLAVGEPERFVLRSVDARFAHQQILSASEELRRRLAFRACVVRVRNWRGPGDFTEWMPEAQRAAQPRGLLVTERELELFDPGTIDEIGDVALTRLFLSPRRRRLEYGLPPSWLFLLERTPGLAAALMRGMERPDGPSE